MWTDKARSRLGVSDRRHVFVTLNFTMLNDRAQGIEKLNVAILGNDRRQACIDQLQQLFPGSLEDLDQIIISHEIPQASGGKGVIHDLLSWVSRRSSTFHSVLLLYQNLVQIQAQNTGNGYQRFSGNARSTIFELRDMGLIDTNKLRQLALCDVQGSASRSDSLSKGFRGHDQLWPIFINFAFIMSETQGYNVYHALNIRGTA